MDLQQKTAQALEIIQESIPKHQAPVVYSSFGKDSMVMLDLVKRAGLKLPIIFHRETQVESRVPEKYAFANQVIAAESYEVHDWDPLLVRLAQRGSMMDIVSHHATRGGRIDYLSIGILPPVEGKSWFCGLSDFYLKPQRVQFDSPWDLGFIGNKHTDKDRILGPVPVAMRYEANPESCSFAFPIVDFTDEDIWAYTLERGLPINHGRYDQANSWQHFEDDSQNPDYFRACVACMDKTQPSVVHCPEWGGPLENIGGKLLWADPDWQPTYAKSRAEATS